MDDVKLSLRQIEKMEHAIGFERGKIKRNRYKVYRNWYIVNHPDDDWEELVFIGYANRRLLDIEKISGITSKNGRNGTKWLNINTVRVSDDAKPKMLKKQRKAELSRRTVCKSLPAER